MQSRSRTGNLCHWLKLFDEASVHLKVRSAVMTMITLSYGF